MLVSLTIYIIIIKVFLVLFCTFLLLYFLNLTLRSNKNSFKLAAGQLGKKLKRKLFVENSIKRLENPHAINVLFMTRHYKWYRFECHEVGHKILEIFRGSKWFKCIYMLISRKWKWKGILTWPFPYKPIIARIFFRAHISSGCYLTLHFVKENCRSFISRSITFSNHYANHYAPMWNSRPQLNS